MVPALWYQPGDDSINHVCLFVCRPPLRQRVAPKGGSEEEEEEEKSIRNLNDIFLTWWSQLAVA